MPSIFTKIINKEIPSHIVYEDANFIVFLDVFPLAKGHTLVVPKIEIDKLFELDIETYNGLMSVSYKIAQAIGKALPCLRVGMSVVGLEVPHAHVHLVPLNRMEDISFTSPRQNFTQDEFQTIATEIKNNLDY